MHLFTIRRTLCQSMDVKIIWINTGGKINRGLILHTLEDNSLTDSESVWWVRSYIRQNGHEKLRQSIHGTELRRNLAFVVTYL